MKNSQEVAALEQQADAIRSFVYEEYFVLHPDKVAWKSDPKIKSLCQDDIAKHLGFLEAALERNSTTQFVNYALWLRGVFESRNIPIQHFSDGLVLLKKYLNKQGNTFLNGSRFLNEALAAISDKNQQMSIINTSTQPDIEHTESYLKALLEGKSRQAWDHVEHAVSQNMSFSSLGTNIIQPAMYKVGDLWQRNQITVADEHLASSITQNTLAKSLALMDYQAPNDRPALFSCIEGNHHAIGLRIIADSFEIAGWDVTFLGANTPSDNIVSMSKELKPELLGLSVALTQQLPALKTLTDAIHKEFGAERPFILVGGLATNQLGGMLDDIQVDQWIPHAQAISTQLSI